MCLRMKSRSPSGLSSDDSDDDKRGSRSRDRDRRRRVGDRVSASVLAGLATLKVRSPR